MTQISDILQGAQPDPQETYANFKPVRYRYVMAYLHEFTDENGVVHQPGEVMAILSMTSVTYGVGMYAGTEMSGTVNLPEQTLDQLPHPPVNDFDRWVHPDVTGIPVGSMFECGNRAIYILRNDEVVWGGILWTRSYNSGTPQLQITALSWDGYIYYRCMRRTISFPAPTNMYSIWYAMLRQTLTDFDWYGARNGIDQTDGSTTIASGLPPSTTKKKRKPEKPKKKGDPYWEPHEGSSNYWVYTYNPGWPDLVIYWVWTGITREWANADPRYYIEMWPPNNPRIELPDENLKLYKNGAEVVTTRTWRGYDLPMVGTVLEEWADTDTVASDDGGGKTRLEYRVVCWFDSAQQRFRQRYVCGEMSYPAGQDPNEPYPNGIVSPFLGKNTSTIARSPDNQLVFDYPGAIADWSLSEGMDEAATRVIVSDNSEANLKHAEYSSDKDLLNIPAIYQNIPPYYNPRVGREGWLLYDRVESYDSTDPAVLRDRANRLLTLFKVPQAAQLSDIPATGVITSQTQRTSIRATQLDITLYSEPSRPLPEFTVGDWAVFAIEDPFYGGKMYLVRRIMGYTVTVVPEQESDYSHESITLELTDDTQIDLGT